ncbi:hypothetical protein BDZ94DRAFT_1260572 [Collybia nuda]|uniref:HSF-type DNA-binding domain-containing protein n=1 Tax=Collybia nuda TaxID=64659 RepID=A0A9P5Y4U0_9AGAR|nr:hypothetical protein BDZ94DRAFT_1260572 [Collybia nuda]
MASGQVALTRHRTPVAHASKSSRPIVPAFLQKLFEMVNDPNNVELIRWSDAGDTFFVLDHERFAREVLGRWFKHQNFSSFVRQLNMYGFHKIPHLQQGVLRSDTDTEFWNFAHPHFHRGQPDLLCLIQRKKQMAQPGEEVPVELRDTPAAAGTATATSPPALNNLSAGQVLDINSIVNGITAIKRHQATISTELNELKRSNQMLWQDAMDARAKHQKQQDTINRIVKFLAGVFGNRTTPRKEDAVDSGTVVSRRGTRLMIEDGRRGGKVDFSELFQEENEFNEETPSEAHYPSIETPQSAPSPAPSDNTTTSMAETYFGAYDPSLNIPPQPPQPPTPPHSSHIQVQPPQPPPQNPDRSITPSRSPTNLDFDPRVQGVLNQLSPSQIQQLLASIASQPIDPLPSDSPTSSSQLTSYQPHFDFTQYLQPTITSPPPPQPPPIDGLISFDPTQARSEFTQQVDNQWKQAETLDKRLEEVDAGIDSIMQGLRFDAHQDPPMTQPNGEVDPSMLETSNVLNNTDPTAPDFDFTSFLNSFNASDHADYADSASTAFLDEVPSDGTSSPITHLGGSPQARLQRLSRAKRKSDVSDLGGELSKDNTLSSGARSPKRKRDK